MIDLTGKGAAYKYVYFLDTIEKMAHSRVDLALPSVSMAKFKNMLKRTTPDNPMTIKWRTAEPQTHRTTHTVYWGQNYSNSDASITKEEEGMVNLVSLDGSSDWTTLTYDNISSFEFEGNKYVIN
jgi:hypothetical protein